MAEGLFFSRRVKEGGEGGGKGRGEITEPERTERPWGKDTAKEWSGVGELVRWLKKGTGIGRHIRHGCLPLRTVRVFLCLVLKMIDKKSSLLLSKRAIGRQRNCTLLTGSEWACMRAVGIMYVGTHKHQRRREVSLSRHPGA